jgi:anti-sigma28 factor (negative regulator of flagellin synthesis)
MRITPLGEAINVELRKAESRQKIAEKTPHPKASTADRTDFSSSAQRLSDTKATADIVSAQISAQPDIRPEKVADAREKIQRGYYDSAEFADKLADKLLEEFGIKKPSA